MSSLWACRETAIRLCVKNVLCYVAYPPLWPMRIYFYTDVVYFLWLKNFVRAVVLKVLLRKDSCNPMPNKYMTDTKCLLQRCRLTYLLYFTIYPTGRLRLILSILEQWRILYVLLLPWTFRRTSWNPHHFESVHAASTWTYCYFPNKTHFNGNLNSRFARALHFHASRYT